MAYQWRRDYGDFQLECWGNGQAYALTHKPTNQQVYLQGDDAILFEKDRATALRCWPEKTDAEIMLWLWDQCDYGSAAVSKC